MRRTVVAALVALLASAAASAYSAPDQVTSTTTTTAAANAPLDMETIMANPDWVGHAVESPYWGVDGRSLYYSVQRDGMRVRASRFPCRRNARADRARPARVPVRVRQC